MLECKENTVLFWLKDYNDDDMTYLCKSSNFQSPIFEIKFHNSYIFWLEKSSCSLL